MRLEIIIFFILYIINIMDNFWSVGIAVFLCVLSFIKYTDTEKLKDCIDEYIDRILPEEEIEEEEVVELEEVSDMIYDFVIRNKEIFSRIKVKDGSEGTEGTTKES